MSKISERKQRNNQRKRYNKYHIDYLVRHNKLSDIFDNLQEDNKLYEGQKFDSWPDLFDYLNFYYPDSGNKSLFQEHIKRYIRVNKDKDSKSGLVIEEIYENPVEWTDGRAKGNHSVYITFFSSILLWLLLQEKEKSGAYSIQFSYNDFWKAMGMRNSYYNNKDVQQLLPEFDEEMTPELLDDFFRWSGSKNRNITDYILDSLDDKGLLTYKKIRMIREKNGTKREATDEEIALIGSEEHRMMREMGYKNKKDLFMSGNTLNLYKKVKESIKLNYFDELSIIIFEKDVLTMGLMDSLKDLKKQLKNNINDNKKELNNKITTYDIRNAYNRHDKEKDKVDQAYKEYVDNRALGKVESIDEFIEKNGNSLYYDNTYIQRFEKAVHYFSDLCLSKDMKDTLIAAEQEAERRRLEELNKRKKDEDDD